MNVLFFLSNLQLNQNKSGMGFRQGIETRPIRLGRILGFALVQFGNA